MSNEGFNDPRRAYTSAPPADEGQDIERFAPADNLYDAIRADVEPIGGIDFRPLLRDIAKEPPFSDLDWDPNDDE